MIRYKDKVKVVSDFYEGEVGVALDKRYFQGGIVTDVDYEIRVELEDKEIWISEDNLEKIDDQPN